MASGDTFRTDGRTDTRTHARTHNSKLSIMIIYIICDVVKCACTVLNAGHPLTVCRNRKPFIQLFRTYIIVLKQLTVCTLK